MSFAAFLPFAKIFLVFAAMLAGIRLRIGLGNSIMAGALAIGLAFAVQPSEWLGGALRGALSSKSFFLCGVVGLILLLSDLLEKTGQSERLMESLKGYLRHPRLRLAFFPALIGLLPMPGGAVFSAPMLKSAATGLDVSDQDKVLINYWLRHVWEPSWPMYPGLLLAASLASVPIMELAALGIPSTLFWIALGWIFFLRPGVLPLNHGAAGSPAESFPPRRPGVVLREGLPLIVAIVGAIAMEGIIAGSGTTIPFEAGVIVALFLSICCAVVQNKGAARLALRGLISRHLYSMLYVVLAIFAFKEVLQLSGAIGEMASQAGGTAALITAAVILPFLTGMVGGITMAFVGSSFPLLLGVLQQLGMGDQKLAYCLLALFSGYAGCMCSPLHICFILTCQYFGQNLVRSMRRVAVPSLLLLLWGTGYWWILL
ncbi:MAG: DUF401 family protein [Desulfovibrionaceae bacterium]|nr:DUF401 family protein [Desulfovibrionaceae bacterium]